MWNSVWSSFWRRRGWMEEDLHSAWQGECLMCGKTIINHPFGNGLYHLFMVIWGMVYYCFTHIAQILFSGVFYFQFSHDTHRAMQDFAVTCGFYRLLIKNRWFWLSSDPKFVVGLRCVLISGIMMRNVSTTKHSACWHAKSFYFSYLHVLAKDV